MRKSRNGFTMIELLVVITILGALAAGATVWVQVAGRKRAELTTNTRMHAIVMGLEKVKAELGYYPPTSTRALKAPGMKQEKIGEKAGQPNDTNIGIETVYISFNMNGVNVPSEGLDDEGALGNTDEDDANQLVGTLVKTDMLEYLDAWGNPFIYIAARDYKKVDDVDDYMTATEETVTVEVLTNEQTGKPLRATSFQLFSMGPDGKPNTEDDLVYK